MVGLYFNGSLFISIFLLLKIRSSLFNSRYPLTICGVLFDARFKASVWCRLALIQIAIWQNPQCQCDMSPLINTDLWISEKYHEVVSIQFTYIGVSHLFGIDLVNIHVRQCYMIWVFQKLSRCIKATDHLIRSCGRIYLICIYTLIDVEKVMSFLPFDPKFEGVLSLPASVRPYDQACPWDNSRNIFK